MELEQKYTEEITTNDYSEFQALKETIQGIYNIDILAPNRKHEVVEARMIFSLIMRERGWTLKSIGTFLGKDHTTIIHYLQNIEFFMSHSRPLRKMYERILKAFDNEQYGVNALDKDEMAVEIKKLRMRVEALSLRNEKLVSTYNRSLKFSEMIDFLHEELIHEEYPQAMLRVMKTIKSMKRENAIKERNG
jgi:transcriptional regulator with XRE-family HTH domain